MARTTSAAVIAVLGRDYDTVNNWSLSPYIEAANGLINQLINLATANSRPIPTSTQAELLERWLAAHYYTKADPTYSSKSTSGASGSFIRGKTEPEPYKDVVLGLDPSGILNALLNRLTAGGVWLGKPPSEQTPYEERN